MSGHATMNVVDDEEMSSQGSVHSPLTGSGVGTPVQTPVTPQVIPVAGSPLRPQSPMAHATPTVQSSVLGHPSAFATTVPAAAASWSGQLSSVAPVEARYFFSGSSLQSSSSRPESTAQLG